MSSAVQAPYVTIIKSLPGLSIEQFWASNILLVKGLTETSLDTLAAMQGDFLLREQITVSVNDVILDHNVTITTESAQWGVARIRAPAAWTVTQGAGCIVNIVDTGVSLDHEALADAWEGGWKGMYYNPPSPIDQHGHGSHVTGTILGRTNGVGVAPAAQWIACQGLNHQGAGTEAALIGCAQWSIIYRPKPHVSSNCWGGGSGSPWYDSSITAMRAADIIPVFAIGNSGPNCGTANSPGDRPNVISVGATTPTDSMANFSSRGPNTLGSLKPEVSAPGVGIISSGTGPNNYVSMSGTNIAAPHVVGAICLLLSANPEWGFDEVYSALASTAAQPPISEGDRFCGRPAPGPDYPNHAWGHGLIDVGKALGQ